MARSVKLVPLPPAGVRSTYFADTIAVPMRLGTVVGTMPAAVALACLLAWENDPRFAVASNGTTVVTVIDEMWRAVGFVDSERLTALEHLTALELIATDGSPDRFVVDHEALADLINHTETSEQPAVELSEEDKARAAEVDRLCRMLAELIGITVGRVPRITHDGWVDAIDKMIRLDEITPAKIENAILWCQSDDFWQPIILSGKNLRKHYVRLLARAKEDGPTAAEKIARSRHRLAQQANQPHSTAAASDAFTEGGIVGPSEEERAAELERAWAQEMSFNTGAQQR